MQNQKSALGLDGNVTALIGYLIGIVALILIFIEKDNRFVRFHAVQSVLWSATCFVATIVIFFGGCIIGIILGQVSETLGAIVGGLAFLLYLALLFGMIAGLIFGAIKAFGGDMFKLPLVGNYAERWA